MADEKKAKDTAKKADKKSDKKKSGKNPFKAIGAFFKSVRSEGKKVVWPKPLEVFKNTVIVLVVILILGLIIFGIDQALTQGMKGLKNLAAENTTVSEQADTSNAEEAIGDLVGGLVSDAIDENADAIIENAENSEETDDNSADNTEETEAPSEDTTE